ncbi:acetyltransferase [Vibrio ponticus]|nr:acetyltransferase [Vibrio ponticus]
MVREGLESLRDFGYPACVVLGDPAYYSRFGFSAAEQHNFRCQWDVPVGAFQVLTIADNEFAERSGLIEYSPEFANV